MREQLDEYLQSMRINAQGMCFLLGSFLTSLGMSVVDTVKAWGGKTSTPPGSNYFSEFFSPSHIKLTNNNPHKDFKSVKRP